MQQASLSPSLIFSPLHYSVSVAAQMMQFLSHPFKNGSTLAKTNINSTTDGNNIPVIRPSSIADEGTLRIHVGNIPFSWSEKHLREQFDIFGPVDDVEVVSNAQGSKGFGFLTFLRRRDGERAMQVKNGTIADGRKITVSLAVAKTHSTPPPTPARAAFRSISTNRPMPLLATSSSLSPDAPMWAPLTPPSSTGWRISPESQSNGWTNESPSSSSSPLSMLFPPLVPAPHAEQSTENENVDNSRQVTTAQSINTERQRCTNCPYCGRTIY